MLKKNRTILFLICSFLFLLLAPSIILYSQGYRINFTNKKISQTGGFFFRVLPRQAEIYLDGKLAKKTDFFFGSALVENLLPKKYKVELKKEGYYSWEKNLELKEKEVTEIKTAVLFPKNPNFSVLATGLENAWLSPDQKNIIFYEKENNIWSLKLYELEKNLRSYLVSEKDISLKSAELLNLEFSLNSREVSLTVKIEEKIRYFSFQIDKIPSMVTENKLPLVLSEIAITYQKINNDIYYLDKLGYVFKTDYSFSTKQRLNEKSFLIKQEASYNLKVFQDNVFLQENKTFYRLDSNLKSFEKFSEDINDIKISPNEKRMVYFSDYEIWILYIKDDLPRRKAGDKVFLMRLSEKIKNLSWMNSDYLVFTIGNTIKVSETDDRDKLNVINIAEYKDPEPFWSEPTKKLYILSEGNLYQSDQLIK